MKHDILIVGAGIAGLMSAIELANAGLRPRLFDAGQAGRESSWASGGILSPIYPWHYPDTVNDLAQWGMEHYPEYFARLKAATAIDPQWLPCGHLILQADPEAADVKQWVSKYAVNIRSLDQSQLQKIEPGLNTGFNQGLWLPDIGQVRNPRLVRALKTYAEKIGITVSEHIRISSLLTDNNQITGIETDKDRFFTDRVLITAGAWSGRFKLSGTHADIQPVKGQMIQFQTPPGSIQRITLNEGHYVIPRKDGKVLVGSTLEHDGFNKSISNKTRDKLRAVAISIYPILATTPIINHWAGLRPGNERQIPYIGPHPEIDGLYFNTGHYRNGIVLGLASARLSADIIAGNQPIFPPAPYRLN